MSHNAVSRYFELPAQAALPYLFSLSTLCSAIVMLPSGLGPVPDPPLPKLPNPAASSNTVMMRCPSAEIL